MDWFVLDASFAVTVVLFLCYCCDVWEKMKWDIEGIEQFLDSELAVWIRTCQEVRWGMGTTQKYTVGKIEKKKKKVNLDKTFCSTLQSMSNMIF